MTKSTKKTYRNSICFKQKVVEEIRAGVSRKYGIKEANTVRNRVQRYGDQGMLNEVICVKIRNERNRFHRYGNIFIKNDYLFSTLY
jgi:hypothetical protein